MSDSKCPHCQAQLQKVPQRKARCPFCSASIFVRTHPDDKRKVLVTEAQAEAIDLQWAEKHAASRYAPVASERKGFKEEKEIVRRKLGGEPSDATVLWSLLLKERQAHSALRDWGQFRNVTYEMAEALIAEKAFRASLPYFVDVCLLDAWLEEDLEKELRIPSTELSTRILGGILDRLSFALKGAGMTPDALLPLVAERRLKLPMLSRWDVGAGEMHGAICSALAQR